MKRGVKHISLFDPLSKTWSAGPPLPSAGMTSGPVGAVEVNGKLHLIYDGALHPYNLAGFWEEKEVVADWEWMGSFSRGVAVPKEPFQHLGC